MIQVRDIVFHSPSGLYYICENKKQEMWMNMSGFYSKMSYDQLMDFQMKHGDNYFAKSTY